MIQKWGVHLADDLLQVHQRLLLQFATEQHCKARSKGGGGRRRRARYEKNKQSVAGKKNSGGTRVREGAVVNE